MFFPERIVSIKETDRVLEVGPGGTPYPRSNILLEKIFDEEDAREQRGHAKSLKTGKELVFYEGEKFPFEDNEFDYVVCSHVLEHIPSNEIESFLSEIQRVGKRGYLEFPTIYYDYIYNFPKHLTFLLYENGIIKYLGKEKTQLDIFKPVQKFFYNSASSGHVSLTQSLKAYYFQGFEWNHSIQAKEVFGISDIVYSNDISTMITPAINNNISCRQKLKNQLKNKLSRYKKWIRIHLFQDKFFKAHQKWVEDRGDDTLRLEYTLNKQSVVFDLGGYQGDFAEKIFEKYDSTIYIFEPVESFYQHIVNRFKDNPKIKIFNFGLSDKDCEIDINLSEDGSSVFTNSGVKETIILKDIVLFLKEHNIVKIDLFKINIEGGEFEVLPALIDNNLVGMITDIQIQFHTFIDNAKQRRNKIRDGLAKTHRLTYDYWFIWENWKLK